MVVGVILSLMSSLAINAGNLVEKRAVERLPEISPGRVLRLVRTVFRSRLWVAGFAMTVVGLGLQVMAFSYAPIVVVQSIFNAGIALVVIASRVILKERLHHREWLGLTIVIAALISIGMTLGSGNAVGLPGTQGLVVLAALVTLGAVALTFAIGRSKSRLGGMQFGLCAGLLYGAATVATKGASTIVAHLGVVSSVPHIVLSVYPYQFVVLSMCGMAVYQTGLQRARFAMVGSMSDVVNSTYVVLVGGLIFGDPSPSGLIGTIARYVGFAFIVVGSILVASGPGPAERAKHLRRRLSVQDADSCARGVRDVVVLGGTTEQSSA